MLETVGVEARRTADYTVYFVALLKEQLGPLDTGQGLSMREQKRI
jgi:hypothetical protein